MRNTLMLTALLVATASQAMVIDDFSDGNAAETHTAITNIVTSTAATVPGGIRGMGNDLLANQFDLQSTVKVASGVFSVATDPEVLTKASLVYGDTSIGASDLNLDLSSATAFSVDIVYNDLSGTMQIKAWSSTTGSAVSNIHNFGSVAFGSPQTVTFDFSEFGMAMNDIDTLELDITGERGNDIIVDNFQTTPVPEPTTLVFGLATLAGLATSTRRK